MIAPGTVKRFLKFGIVGCGGFVVDSAALLFASALLGLDPYSGRILSFLAAATFTWYANRKFTFADRNSTSPLVEWARFLAANATGMVANFLAYGLVIALFGTEPWVLVGAVAAGSLSGMVLNFTLSARFVFRG
ncbi:GtrA family protein [Nisaea sediminum]|uniref:GtrA family protein n=1 Tax=Nisaea sediminum TaxID=2775867 RepID=UPI001868023C|nr:GtrA family protein [Nisaea sediminum]